MAYFGVAHRLFGHCMLISFGVPVECSVCELLPTCQIGNPLAERSFSAELSTSGWIVPSVVLATYGCAGYFGHPFAPSAVCLSGIPLL
jgi:hypothetical protein